MADITAHATDTEDAMSTQDLIAAAQERGGRVIIIDFPGDIPEAVAGETEEATAVDKTPAEIAEEQEEALKVAGWSALVGVPIRELQRAISCDALPSRSKGSGRDATAFVIEPADMAGYLRLCSAVQSGHHEPPTWWSDVRKGRAGEIEYA